VSRVTMRKRVLIVVAGLIAGAYGAYLGTLYLLQRSLIYPGRYDAVASSAPLAHQAELLEVATVYGRSEALFLPARAGGSRPLLIFAHGNGEVIDYWTEALEGFRERGIGVLLVEYPGYGRSGGTPSEASIGAALTAAYDRIVTDPRVDRTRILGFGQSLGGGAICLLSRRRPLTALILESTFTSLDTFAAAYLAPVFLLRDHFNNLDAVRAFAGPVLVIHGRHDPVVPWQQGRQLAAAARHGTFRLYDCGHLCWQPQRLPFWNDATPFLRAAGILPAEHPVAPSVQQSSRAQQAAAAGAASPPATRER
jgi:uncharacterized protein